MKKVRHLIVGEIIMPLTILFFNVAQVNAQSKELRERSEIEDKYKWKTEDVFKSDDEWKEKFENLKTKINEFDKFQGKLSKSSELLLNCLKVRDEIDIQIDRLSIYAHLKSDEDTRVTKYQGYRDQVSSLAVQINQKEAFIQPEILQIPENKLWQFVEDQEGLEEYRHYFEDLLRSKDHVLSEEGEELLALAGDMSQSSYRIFSMFNNADIKFSEIEDEKGNKVELTKANFFVFQDSPDRRVREDAFREMYNTYQSWINTLAAALSGAVKKNIYYAKARKYNSALEATLHSDNIPISVYQNVISTLNKNLTPMHRYISIRKKVLGLDKVYPWDLYVPLLKELQWKVSYEEAVETIQIALAPLGEDYLAIMKKGFTSRWFDVYENKGKRSGAYSSSVYGIPHPYMLLNYQNMLDDMFTVAHEMGHSIHSYYTMKNQPYIYSDYTTFVAEVASTLNEALLMDYLIKKTTNKEKKLYLINQYADQIRGTMYIQAIFAEFEKRIHDKLEAGEALTSDFYNGVARDIYTRYYGPDFEMDPIYDINWCRIPHFYYNFYVYQYATGIAAATAIAQKIISGDMEARDAYLNFLKSGNSDYSINLLKDAGVDMTSPQPIEATAILFSDLIDEMEKLLGY